MQGLDVSVGSLGDAGAGDGGGGGAAQAPVAQPTQGRARSTDFAQRMMELDAANDNAAWQQPAPKQHEDPGAPKRQFGGESYEDPNAQPEEVQELAPDEQQPIDPNDPEAVEAAEYKPLFDAMRNAIKTGEPMDAEMIAQMPCKVTTHDGRERIVPFEEMQRGYIRQSRMTAGLQEANQMRGQAEHILNLERARTQQWRDHNELRRGLRQMGLGEAFERAVYAEAEERVAFNRLPPEQKQLVQMRRQMEAQIAHERQQLEMLKQSLQQQQQQTPDQVTQQFQHQLSQMLPRAFKKYDLRDTPTSRSKFLAALQVHYDPERGLTADTVEAAAQSTREEMEWLAEMAAKQNGQRPANGNAQQPVGPRRLSGAAGAGVQTFAGKRARPSDFGARGFGMGV